MNPSRFIATMLCSAILTAVVLMSFASGTVPEQSVLPPAPPVVDPSGCISGQCNSSSNSNSCDGDCTTCDQYNCPQNPNYPEAVESSGCESCKKPLRKAVTVPAKAVKGVGKVAKAPVRVAGRVGRVAVKPIRFIGRIFRRR
jgi:hypothetical protein